MLLSSLLLVVLIIRNIILVASICSVWIYTTVILRVLSAVICSRACSSWRLRHSWWIWCWAHGDGSLRRSLVVVASTGRTISHSVRLTITLAVTSAISTLRWRLLLKSFVLFLHVSKEVLAKSLSPQHFIAIRTSKFMLA